MPVDLPVEVCLVPIPWWGDCERVGQEYRVRLACELDAHGLVETLAHEWAHARTWRGPSRRDHSDAWGVEYARAYRLVVDGVR